jgi:hypothetical protein
MSHHADDVIVAPELIPERPEKQHKDRMDARAAASLRLTMAMGACLAVGVLLVALIVLHYAGMVTAWSLLAPVVLAFPAVRWMVSAERSHQSLPAGDQPDRNDLATRPDDSASRSRRPVPGNSAPGQASH